MKRILFITIGLVMISTISAQRARTGKFRIIDIPYQAKNASFGSSRNEIVFQQAGSQEEFLFHTRKESVSDHDPMQPESNRQIPEIKVRGKQIEILAADMQPRKITPNGDVYYVWASLSPGNDKLLYTAAGKGTFICDLEGRIEQSLGKLNAPEWVSDHWIVGMKDKDNGHRFTESDVYLVHVQSGREFLTTSRTDEIAMYPSVSPDMKRILFNTPDGHVFSARLRLKE